MKTERWYSERLRTDLTLVRWGEVGRPVLVFPTAGGDAWEIERMGLVDALGPLMADGRIKVYSVDSIAGRSWLAGDHPLHSAWLQNMFEQAVRWEVIPAIQADTGLDLDVITAGASIGAFNALALLCRHPDVIAACVAMSGTFHLERWLDGEWSDDFYFSSPLHFLPGLEGWQLDRLRDRFAMLATGDGAHEAPGESWRAAEVLGSKGIPNRVDVWTDWPHDWPTWRAMLPKYLAELS